MKKLDILFYFALALSLLIFLLPYQYKAAVYTPNVLGWIWLVLLLPLTVVSFVLASINNIKNKNWRDIKLRSTVFIFVLLLSIVYWYLVATQQGST